MTAALLLLALADAINPTTGAALLPPAGRWAAVTGCVRLSAGEGPGAAASAVCVGYKDGHAYLLTANHAVPEGKGRQYEFYTERSYPKAAHTVGGGEVLVRLPEADVALVRVQVEGPPVVAPLAGPGERPKHYPFRAVSVGCPAGWTPFASAERVEGKRLARWPDGGVAFFWQLEKPPVGGMSGGPLLDDRGRVIGICTARAGEAGYYAHHDEVLAGLKRNGYGWLIPPAGR